MSTDQKVGDTSHKKVQQIVESTDTLTGTTQPQSTALAITSEQTDTFSSETATTAPATTSTQHRKDPLISSSKLDQTTDASTTPTSTPEDHRTHRPRQVIAVSANKGPTAFFNLARKFLVTDEICDLSALEGAIVSAADAAHLLVRSKLATIIRVQTSYVTVEPKRRRQAPTALQTGAAPDSDMTGNVASERQQLHRPPQQYAISGEATSTATMGQSYISEGGGRASSGRELRRARIVITVKRTAAYKQWLEDNPLQMIVAEDEDDVEIEEDDVVDAGIVDDPQQDL